MSDPINPWDAEIERLKHDYAAAQHKIGEYVDVTARMSTEIERLRAVVDVAIRRGLLPASLVKQYHGAALEDE